MNWTTVAARGAAVVVAGVAGAASFEHIASVAIGAGERAWVGYALPLSIDGLIVVGVAALLEDKRHGRRGRFSARLAVLVGVIATLAANVASAEPTWTARLVAVTAPLSFLLSVEVLTRTGRRLPATASDTAAAGGAAVVAAVGTAVAANALESTSAAPAPVAVRPTPASRNGSRTRPSSAERVARALAENPDASQAEVATRLDLTKRTVARYWPKPGTAPAGRAPARPSPDRAASVTPATFKPLHVRRNYREREKVPA
jgi:hypothetical protein